MPGLVCSCESCLRVTISLVLLCTKASGHLLSNLKSLQKTRPDWTLSSLDSKRPTLKVEGESLKDKCTYINEEANEARAHLAARAWRV